jgi:SAM-dependent methyltransferase
MVPLSALRCPVTQEPLEMDGQWLRAGDHSYPIIDGIPVLVNEAVSSTLSVDEIRRRVSIDKPSRVRRLIRRLVPKRTPPIGAAERYRAFRKAILELNDGSARALIVGGGVLGEGAHELVDQVGIDLVETDVYLGPRVAIVCDGHHLPFADETFDGVVVQAVLEHVLDPPRVIAEIYRVLKPRGIIYAETPFMQPVHEGPYDFARWTETGHRRLFRMFEALDTGVTAGPATSLLWSLCYFARSLPRRRSQLQLVLEKAVILAFFWLPRLDYYLVRHDAATDGASGVYFLGCKSNEPVTDIDVLMSYRGTISRPVRRRR